MIALVIPTVRGRESYLRLLLQSIASSRLPKNTRIEMTIVYDGDLSKDNPLVTEDFDDRFTLRFIHNKNKAGAAKARNAGIRGSQGEIVCFLDDDMIVHPEYFSRLLSSYERGTDGVVGKIWLAPPSLRSKSCEELWQVASEHGFRDGGVSGANMSFTREALRKIGGFDEQLGVFSYSEDMDILMRARRIGCSVLHSKACPVIHFKALHGGIEGAGLSVTQYLYWSVRNDTYVYLKNQTFPLSMLRAYRKTLRRIRNVVSSGRESAMKVLVASSVSVPRAYLSALRMYNRHWKLRSRRRHEIEDFPTFLGINKPSW